MSTVDFHDLSGEWRTSRSGRSQAKESGREVVVQGDELSGGPFGETPLVEGQADRVHLVNHPVKLGFEVSMGSERLFDVPHFPLLRLELNWLKVLDIITIEKLTTKGTDKQINGGCGDGYLETRN
jgi:hypothetical protein